MKRPFIFAAMAAMLASPSWAAKVRVWHHHEAGDHDKAELKQVVLATDGAMRLSRQLRPFADIDATQVWAVTEDKAGNLYVATGHEGKLFKIAADGTATIAFNSEDSQILSLAAAADG